MEETRKEAHDKDPIGQCLKLEDPQKAEEAQCRDSPTAPNGQESNHDDEKSKMFHESVKISMAASLLPS